MVLKKEELTEEDVKVPIRKLVLSSKKPVKIRNMEDYADIFFSIENTVFYNWSEFDSVLNDQDVLNAYNQLLEDFDNQKENSLSSEISKSVKAFLLMRKKEGMKDYTYGEIASCVSYIIEIANNHKSPDGLGYLKWIRTFFEGNMPKNIDEIAKYMFENEI
ncbi:MAG: hypothetical protein AYK22_01650 [Thermoplasmatales archaeon SG8-52-3]|nr:MAG: hypothetical protein AYK22_01650 [Thermoplasmatales archaeon SG8-52-3]